MAPRCHFDRELDRIGARPPQPEPMGEQALAMFAQAKAAFEQQDLQTAHPWPSGTAFPA